MSNEVTSSPVNEDELATFDDIEMSELTQTDETTATSATDTKAEDEEEAYHHGSEDDLVFDIGADPFMETPDKWNDGAPLIAPSQRRVHDISTLTKLRAMDGNSTEIAEWLVMVEQASLCGAQVGTDDSALNDPEAKWQQGIENIANPEGHAITLAIPRMATPTTGRRLTGDAALTIFGNMRGRGRRIWTTTPSSGYWALLRAPSLSEDIDLDEMIADEKLAVGVMTGGIAWSQVSTYTVRHLADFIFNHIERTNVETWNRETFYKYTKVSDLISLGRALLAARYSRGYPLRRPCTFNPESCTDIVSQHVNFTKMLWTDNNKLSKEQKIRLGRHNKLLTLDDLKKHQDDFNFKDSTLTLGDGMEVVFTVPSIEKFIESGDDWISGLSAMAEETLKEDLGTRRNRYVNKQARATSACQYSSWVECIRLRPADFSLGDEDEGYTIEDPEAIASTLSDNSSDEELVEALKTGVLKYIASSTVTVFGVPNYTCKHCGRPQREESENDEHRTIVPLDLIQVFMNLVNLRIETLKNVRL